jgi:hypothetical protein
MSEEETPSEGLKHVYEFVESLTIETEKNNEKQKRKLRFRKRHNKS